MASLDQRAQDIYGYLKARQGQGFTITALCAALRLRPGAKTSAAINRARDLAVADGLHFPPAVPANGFTYKVTDLPVDALDPALHMSRIEQGARARADVGYEFIQRNQRQLPRELKPTVKALLAVQAETQRAAAALQKIADDMVVETVTLRREQRSDES